MAESVPVVRQSAAGPKLEKRLVNVLLEIMTTSVSVKEASTVQVYWNRSDKEQKTKPKTVDQTNCKAPHKERFEGRAGVRFDSQEGVWHSDINKLTLKCADQVVGVCTFDIASFVDLPGTKKRIYLKPEDYQLQGERDLVMLGNVEKYPNTYLDIFLVVGYNQPMDALRQAKNVKPRTEAIGDQAIERQIEDAQRQVRNEYKPQIDALDHTLSKLEQQAQELRQKKENLQQRLAENQSLSKGDEEKQIRLKRKQIAEISEQIEQEREQQALLEAQVMAYNKIKGMLGDDLENEDRLQELLEQYTQEKKQLEKEISQSASVQLYDQMYEIDYDAY